MRILGIESSCDESAIALLDGKGDDLTVVSSVVLSQVDIHKEFGGIVPEVAAREHVRGLLPLFDGVVERDGSDIDAIAVTRGPGLSTSLQVGLETAKSLSYVWNKPLVGVNHLKGHVYSAWLGEGVPEFPALCLLVSGGHTELVVMRGHGDFEKIGSTIDDAAGEAFDKVGSMLGLEYPGGPKVSTLAVEGDEKAFDFPRPMIDRDNYDFSFSGLKTSVLYKLRKMDDVDAVRADVAASFEEAVVDVLCKKTFRAIEEFGVKNLIVAGGVAANRKLRARLVDGAGVDVYLSEMQYATDNAAMIAAAGYFDYLSGVRDDAFDLIIDTNLNF